MTINLNLIYDQSDYVTESDLSEECRINLSAIGDDERRLVEASKVSYTAFNNEIIIQQWQSMLQSEIAGK